ncbi:MAG: inositol monophosphatase family protein [Pyrobaculum sp.]
MLGVLEAVVVKASHFLLEGFRQRRGLSVIEDKGDDVTREIDLQIEELVYRMLKESYREGGVLYSEERGEYRWGDERFIFVLDPLDGSLNYALGVPLFSISLAAGRYRVGTLSDLEYAVVSIPPTGEIYTAGPGGGVRKDGRPLTRASPSKIVFVALSNDFPEETCKIVKRLGLKGRSLGSSAAELIYTAVGLAKGFVDLRGKLRILDIAGALTVGKYIPNFKYKIIGGEEPFSKVSIIAGDEEFVNAAFSNR